MEGEEQKVPLRRVCIALGFVPVSRMRRRGKKTCGKPQGEVQKARIDQKAAVPEA